MNQLARFPFLYPLTVAVLAITVAPLTPPALASQELAQLKVESRFAEWAPLVEADSLVLRIATPDGRVTEQEFAGGLRPSVEFDGGVSWPDGIYIWELVAREAAAASQAQSGAFWILGGSGVPNGLRDGEKPRHAAYRRAGDEHQWWAPTSRSGTI